MSGRRAQHDARGQGPAGRPSPWRRALDLANMMLVLALRSDPDTVYRRAGLQLTPGELAEAFAATRGITLTSQLRARTRGQVHL